MTKLALIFWSACLPLGQLPEPRVVPPDASSDLYFSELVEDWTISALLGSPGRPPATLESLAGPRGAFLLGGLGSGEYRGRQMARELIALEPPDAAFRMLCVGRRSTSPHVRHESRLLLDYLFYRCAMCRGSGGAWEYGGWSACSRCEGGIYHH